MLSINERLATHWDHEARQVVSQWPSHQSSVEHTAWSRVADDRPMIMSEGRWFAVPTRYISGGLFPALDWLVAFQPEGGGVPPVDSGIFYPCYNCGVSIGASFIMVESENLVTPTSTD